MIRYNIRRDAKDVRDFKFSTIAQSVQLPKSVNLISKCPPVYDQGNLGSCSGNAIAAAYQFIALKENIPAPAPSRLFIYYNERVLEGTVSQDAGAQLRDGIKAIASYGVCPETLWPYDVTKFAIRPIDQAYRSAGLHRALQYHRVNLDLTEIKTALASGYPIVAGIAVYDSFESDAVARNGLVPMPGLNEHCMGGHAVVIVGYDDHTRHLILRNSWGKSWGDCGYFYLDYEYINPQLMMDLWVVSTVK